MVELKITRVNILGAVGIFFVGRFGEESDGSVVCVAIFEQEVGEIFVGAVGK